MKNMQFLFKPFSTMRRTARWVAPALMLVLVAGQASSRILPVNPQTGVTASSFTPSLSTEQFNQAASSLIEFTTENRDFNMFDVSKVLQQQGLNPTQILEVGAQSSMSALQLGELGNAMKLQGVDVSQIKAGFEQVSRMPDAFGEVGANMQKAMGGMGEMANLGAISFGELGKFGEGMILDASSISDITGAAGQLTAQAQQAMQAVTGQIQGMTQAAAAEVMGAMKNVGNNIMGNITAAIPPGLMQGIEGLMGGLNGLLDGLNFPGFGGGFGGFGGGGGAGSAGNYDNAQRSKQVTRATGARGAGTGGKPMPMRGTAKVDTANLTPYLWKSLMGCGDNDPRKFYDGPASTFGRNSAYYSGKMVGYDDYKVDGSVRQVSATTTTSATGPHARLKGCTTRLEPEGGIPNGNYNELSAEFLQMQAQHCANEYTALNSLYLGENNNPKIHGVSAGGDCQPLEMKPPQEEEFDVGEYMKSCWTKLLNDPTHKLREGEDAVAGEPSYAEGMTIVNADHDSVKQPASFPKIEGGVLARNQQEEITYACHPFGMRWDFQYNERDEYSPKTESYNGDNSAVRCSGSKDNVIKVDVINGERKELFDKRVMKRIEFNDQCRKDDDGSMGVCCNPGTFKCTPVPCWQCFGNPKPDNPPCATRYDGKDLSVVSPPYRALGQYKSKKNPQPWCGEVHAEKMCQDVAKSVLFLNKLKLRHYGDGAQTVTGDPNAGGSDEDKLFNAGMKFPDHFENHRPYMRMWDLGTAYGEDPIPTRQQLAKDKGAYVGIVGVGRETPQSGQWDERGMIANGSNDPITGGWSQLKMYQANTMQKFGLSCIGDYSALYKGHSPEERALHAAAGTELQVIDDEVNADGSAIAQTVAWTPSHRGYQTDDIEEGQGVPVDEREREFGYFNDEGKPPTMKTGLDNAAVNDILRLPKGASGNPGKPGLPTVGTILEVTENYVRVSIHNHGKNPTSAGDTDAMGVAAERYFYKPSAQIDPMILSELRQCDLPDGWTHSCPDVHSDDCKPDCEDPGLKKCYFKNWDGAKLYSPRKDYREGEPTS